MRVEFRILGPLDVLVDGEALHLGGPRPRALLAALLVEAGHFVSRGRLIDELWGDEPPNTAENALQAQVAALRRLIPDRIATDGTAYRLTADPMEIDARRFEQAAAQGHDLLARQPARAAAQLATALATWRGPALDGATEGRDGRGRGDPPRHAPSHGAPGSGRRVPRHRPTGRGRGRPRGPCRSGSHG